MSKKCIGCGVQLQTKNNKLPGFVKNLDQDFCERCFRINHYGDYQVVKKDNKEYLEILKFISKTDSLVLFVVDLFNLSKEVFEMGKKISNPTCVILTKRDLFANDIYDKKFTDAAKCLVDNQLDTVLISSKNNKGYDDLLNAINKYKNGKRVYVIGLTNAGKSTMINQFIKHYSVNSSSITTSNLPSTTLDMLEIKCSEDLIFVDTPGILDNSITNFVDTKTLKNITPKNVIKPITYQIKVPQSILVDNLVRIDIEDFNSITLFFSNNLNVTRFYKEHNRLNELECRNISVNDDSDILISGLGFVKFKKKCNVKIWTLKDVEVSVRKALI